MDNSNPRFTFVETRSTFCVKKIIEDMSLPLIFKNE